MVTLLLLASAVTLLLNGCAGGMGRVSALRPPPMSIAIKTGELVAVVAGQKEAEIGWDEPSGRIGKPGEGASDAIKTLWGAAGSAEGGIVALALTPAAALMGAASEVGREVSVEELKKSERRVQSGLGSAAPQSEFQRHFLMVVARQKTLRFVSAHPGILAAGSDGAERRDALRPHWILELAIDEIRLRRSSLGDSHFLTIAARARVFLPKDGGVVYDEPITFTSESSPFMDWSSNNGASTHRVAEHGYRMLAEHIADRIFGLRPQAR